MGQKQYNKLVRDHIPQIILASDRSCEWEVLSDEEYLSRLDEKLQEELDEYLEDKSLEELADLLEVLMAVAEARGSFAEVERIRQKKREKRGGFEKRILLKSADGD